MGGTLFRNEEFKTFSQNKERMIRTEKKEKEKKEKDERLTVPRMSDLTDQLVPLWHYNL